MIVILESSHSSITFALNPLSVLTADVSTGTLFTFNEPDTFVAPDIPMLPVEEVM